MIEINLLPENLRKKKKRFKIPEITIASMPILIGIVSLLVLTNLLLMLTLAIQRGSYNRMIKEWTEAKPQKEAIELARRENISAENKVVAIEELMQKKILWSKKLNQLSNLIIPGVWYTKLSIDKKIVILEPRRPQARNIKRIATDRVEVPYLNIEGEVSSAYGNELAILGKFIEELKNDPDFLKDFSNIELDSTELHSIGDIEIMKFNVNCYFKKVEKDGDTKTQAR